MKNDLFKRVLDFGVGVIEISQQLGQSIEAKAIRSQMVRSATSIGANYQESQSASSKADFINKLQISLKELMETIYWLYLVDRIYAKKDQNLASLLTPLVAESEELRKILNAGILTARSNLPKK
ncbi:MAG: four helix bundle protein [Bacteroidetes bacterium]|nr:four helix bundle protein [Bacteroidota bacterium]